MKIKINYKNRNTKLGLYSSNVLKSKYFNKSSKRNRIVIFTSPQSAYYNYTDSIHLEW